MHGPTVIEIWTYNQLAFGQNPSRVNVCYARNCDACIARRKRPLRRPLHERDALRAAPPNRSFFSARSALKGLNPQGFGAADP